MSTCAYVGNCNGYYAMYLDNVYERYKLKWTSIATAITIDLSCMHT